MRIVRLPKGLLDLAGLQNFGEFPGDATPVIDLTPFLAVGQIIINGSDLVAGYAAASYTAVSRVPAGVIRFFYDVSLSLELGVGQIGSVRLVAQAQGNVTAANRCGLTPIVGTGAAVAAASVFSDANHFSPPLFQPPGEEIGIEVFSAIPAAARVHVGLRYAEYRAQG